MVKASFALVVALLFGIPEAYKGKGRIDTLEIQIPREEPAHSKFVETIGDLTDLKSLTLRGDSGTPVPPQIGRLKSLTSLRASNLKPPRFPGEFENLRQLQSLDLSNNNLMSLPAFVYTLRNLRYLDVSGNNLASLEPDIKNLIHLTTLNIERNRLRHLPPELAALPHLDTLILSENLLAKDDLEPSVVALLDRKGHDWRVPTSDQDLNGLLRGVGKHLLHRNSMFNAEVGEVLFEDYGVSNSSYRLPRFPAKSVADILAKADSASLSAALGKLARANRGRISPREMVRGLLSARAVCERYPAIAQIIQFEIGRFATNQKKPADSREEFRLPYPEYFRGINQKLSGYEQANRPFLLVWGQCGRDNSVREMAQLLDRIRQYCFPALAIDSGDFAEAPHATPLRTIYFSGRSFGDTGNADMRSDFLYKEQLLMGFLEEAYPRNCATHSVRYLEKWRIIQEPRLWQKLLALRSPYFDTALVYFSGSEDSNQQFQWQETALTPSLSMRWSNCENYEGEYRLYTHLVFPILPGNRTRVFVGIPREEYLKNTRRPNGYFRSQSKMKSARSGIAESGQLILNMDTQAQKCRWVTQTYSTPPECATLKTLFVVDQYLSKTWEFMKGFHPVRRRYEPDTSLLATSTLYAVNASGDTAVLNKDAAYWNGWIDGGGEMFGAYTLPPRFTDLNGDGRLDLFVDTREGTIFLLQKKDGSFEKQAILQPDPG